MSDTKTTNSPIGGTKASSDVKPSSDANKSPQKPAFTEKEDRVLKIAMLCLKSGIPEIDLDKFTKMGEFNTQKTAQNTWGIIKKKLLALAPPSSSEESGEEKDATAASRTPKTPSKTKTGTTPKKRGKKEADGDDVDATDENSSPTKKRKSPVKVPSRKVADAATEVKDADKVRAEEQREEGGVKFQVSDDV